MQFQIEYEEQDYIIEVDELKNDKKTKTIFNNFGNDEYEINMFLIKDGEQCSIKIIDMPVDFQETVGKLLHDILPKVKTFRANPYFDEVMVFFGNTIFTSQEKLKPIQCLQCNLPNLYEKRGKENKTGYIQEVQTKLKNNPNPEWPFKEDLMIQFSVSDKKSRLAEVDLDNLTKSIFDSLNGVVFEDDAQIVAFTADKTSVINVVAYIVAIKRLLPDERPKYQEFIFSGRQLSWDEEYQKKIALSKSTRFNTY